MEFRFPADQGSCRRHSTRYRCAPHMVAPAAIHTFLNHDALPDCDGASLRRLKGMAGVDHKSSWTMKRTSAAEAVKVQTFMARLKPCPSYRVSPHLENVRQGLKRLRRGVAHLSQRFCEENKYPVAGSPFKRSRKMLVYIMKEDRR